MLHLTHDTKILLAIEPVDFRKQLDGLIAICNQKLSQNTRSGQLFVFINRSRTMIRTLRYETNGYWLATKRLSRGRFAIWPKDTNDMSRLVLAGELTKILKTCIVNQEKKL